MAPYSAKAAARELFALQESLTNEIGTPDPN